MEVKIEHDALDHALAYHAAEQNNQSDSLSFRLPRYRGSLDLSTLTPSLFLMREDGSTDSLRPAADNILVMETADDAVTVIWTLTDWATALPGELYYQLVFRSAEEHPVRYATFPAKLTIVRSIAAEEIIVSSYPTFLWQWEQEMKKMREDAESSMNQAAELLEQANELLEAVEYPALTAKKKTLPPELEQTDLPDSVNQPGSYYGFASRWSLNGETISGNYFLTVEQNNTPTSAIHMRVQTFFFYTMGRMFTRFWDEQTASGWSDFIEITAQGTGLLRCKSENGLLHNIYSDGSVIYAGMTVESPNVQTYDEATIGDLKDAFVSSNGAPISMGIGGGNDYPNGISVRWNGGDRQQCSPTIRTRMSKLESARAIGLSCYSKRQTTFSPTVELYACGESLGAPVLSYGTVQITFPNDGRIHHLRIPLTSFSIDDYSLPEGATSLCFQISWNNALDTGTQGDEIWFSHVGYYLDPEV